MIVVINGCTIDIAMMRKPPKTWQELADTKRLVSITTDHTLKSGMKGNFHVPFRIGGRGSDPLTAPPDPRPPGKRAASYPLRPTILQAGPVQILPGCSPDETLRRR